MMFKQKTWKFFGLWGLIFLLCIIVRLPFFFSESFFVDEDEAIIGLMSIDFLEGELFPYYFYGQHYGLSFFEVIAGALMIFVFGHSVWALKIAALLIFSLGITFIVKAFKSRGFDFKIVLTVAVLLSIFPTWYLWGSMLRGGYVTGFTAISAIFFIVMKNDKRVIDGVWIGLLTFITFESHTLFILPLMPFIVYWWLSVEKRGASAFVVGITSLGSVILGKLLYRWITGESTTSFSLVGMRWENLVTHLDGIVNGFTGHYFFTVNFDLPLVWKVAAIAIIIMMVVILFVGIIKLTINNKIVLSLIIIGTVSIFALISLMNDYSPRYMISVFTGVLFAVLFVVIHLKSKLMQGLILSLAVLSTIGIHYGSQTPRHWYNNSQNLLSDLALVESRAKKERVKAVIALDSHFLWNYLYGEQLPAANLCWKNRTSEYSLRTKTIFENNPDDVMLIGFHGLAYGIESQENFQSEQVTNNYFIMRKVRESDLLKGRETYPCYF